jgi:hypothetical protein
VQQITHFFSRSSGSGSVGWATDSEKEKTKKYKVAARHEIREIALDCFIITSFFCGYHLLTG